MINPFKMFFPRKMVGIDIGTSSIKVVEVSRWGGGKTLENYGEMKSGSLYKEVSGGTQKGSNVLSSDLIAKTIKGILDEAKIKTKAVIFSIPDFSTFCTSFDMPAMTEKEIPEAIHYNASQYITLPISEVTLDWKILPNNPLDKNSSLKVFLVAIPNQVVQEYQTLARMAGLTLYAIEAEALGVSRSLVKNNNKKAVCVIDIGVLSSTINIVDNGFLKKSYSFNFNSNQLMHVISSSLGISPEQAESIKNNEGLLHSRQDIVKMLYLLIDPLLVEIKSVCAEFLYAEKKQIEEVYLTGGTANLPGLKEYVAESLKKPIYVTNCFSDFLYSPILEETLRDMGPRFSASVGVALGGLDM
ncbi:MAG: type IV pilus assembly protein PilM [Candidatus Staskawiczbacteria bacterium]|nr:type IV pilus assembly protein PilM [Candidatus Staskawiczbacteria bacterium]